jgi:hypothetical protein
LKTCAKAFLDSDCDVSIGDIGAAVLQDSIHIDHMEMLAQGKTQKSSNAKLSVPGKTVIKSCNCLGRSMTPPSR